MTIRQEVLLCVNGPLRGRSDSDADGRFLKAAGCSGFPATAHRRKPRAFLLMGRVVFPAVVALDSDDVVLFVGN